MIGMGYKANRISKQLNRVCCKRCELYHDNKLSDCPHCSQLDDTQLQNLKDQVAEQDRLNSRLGQTIFLALAVVILLTVIFAVL